MTLLDNPGGLVERDPGGMLEQVRGFPAQLARAAAVRDAFLSAHAGFTPAGQRPVEAVVCGMGGSGIGGDYAAAWAAAAGVRVSVHRDYGLPAWVGARHLLVFSSYSGSTEETLSAYRAASGLGAMRVCIASGGELANCARRDGVPLLVVPGGLQPRAALGHSLVAQLVVLHAAGLAADPVPELAATARRLDELQGGLAPGAPAARNPAKQLAARLHNVLAFVCSGDGAMRAVATRFKGQLNENAKTLAIASVLPEMNHNEIMAWSALPDVRARVRVLFLSDADDAAPVRARMQVTRELLSGRVQGCEWLDTHGSTRLERMLSTTHLLDFTSVYLAVLNGVDPTPVELIAQLKERLAAG